MEITAKFCRNHDWSENHILLLWQIFQHSCASLGIFRKKDLNIFQSRVLWQIFQHSYSSLGIFRKNKKIQSRMNRPRTCTELTAVNCEEAETRWEGNCEKKCHNLCQMCTIVLYYVTKLGNYEVEMYCHNCSKQWPKDYKNQQCHIQKAPIIILHLCNIPTFAVNSTKRKIKEIPTKKSKIWDLSDGIFFGGGSIFGLIQQ